MNNRPETPIDVDTNPPAKAYDSVMVEPTFVLLFSVQMTGAFSGFLLIRAEHHPARLRTPAGYDAKLSELERHVFGEDFAAAGRTKRWPLGRIAIPHEGRDAGFPSQADVYLVTHTTGTAIWEAWLHGPSQPTGCFAVDRMARSGFRGRVAGTPLARAGTP